MTPEVGIVCRFQRQRRKAQRLEFAFHPVVGCLDAEESLCAAAAVYQGGAHPWYLAVGSGHSTLIKVSSIRSGGIGNRSITRASGIVHLLGSAPHRGIPPNILSSRASIFLQSTTSSLLPSGSSSLL